MTMHSTTKASPATILPKTDYARWRLKSERGRQTWHYLETDDGLAEWPQTIYDKYHLGMDLVRSLVLSAPRQS
jgi:lanosterol synthase